LPRLRDTLLLNQAAQSAMAQQHQPEDAEAPLLAAGGGCIKSYDAASPPTPAKWNKYPFFCAVLASMTSVLMGYSTYTHPLAS
jgi:hypothetical protein